MRFERLVVGGFGRLRAGLELEFAPGLNLILAPNEAGKTTLAELVVSLFYGFGKRRAGVHPLEPWQGGETGGEIVYGLEPEGRYVLRRHLVRRGDKLSLTDQAGRPVELGGRQPGEVHLGMSRGVFLTVSRIQLDDLHKAFSGDGKVGAAARQDLKGYFFQEAATRGRTENPVTVQADWERRAKALYSADKRSGKADQALNERIKQAREELDQARAGEEEARRVSRELDELDQETRALEVRVSRARLELEKARTKLERARLLARRGEIQAEMAGLTNQGLADQALEQRARDLEKESRRADEEAAGLRARAADLAARIEPAPGSDDPEKARRELVRLEKRLAGLKAREEELQARGARLEEARAEIRAEWGMEAERLARMDQDLPFALGRAREELERARKDANARRQELTALGPRPDAKAWTLALGLGAAALGLVLWIWRYLHPTSGWTVSAGAAALLAGLGLAWRGLAGKRRREAWELQRAELGDPDLLVESARAALAEIVSPWGLDAEKIDPSRLAAQRGRAADLAREAEALAAARTGLQEGRRELAERLAALGGNVSQGLGAALDRLKARLQEASRLRAEIQRLEKEAQAREQTARAREQELNALLSSAELADLKALHEAVLRSRRVRDIGAQLDEVHQQLGGEPQPDERADRRSAQEAMAGSRRRLENLEAQLREMGAERGRRQERLASLNQLPGAARAEAALEELEQRRRELAREHATTLLAGALLTEAMESFHLEAQPSLIHRAGEYLARISGGAYQWLGSDLFRPDRRGEPQLKARSAPGAPEREAADLSRGARDQLYLCLRLALADEITAQGQSAPLLLDDPLVNLDDDRLDASLDMLAQTAGRRQVLLLTCHGQQARLVSQKAGCHVLEIA